MPFTYELPVPKLDDGSSGPRIRLEAWLAKEGDELHRGSAVAVITVSGARYEVRANGEGFLRKRLVKKGDVVATSTPLATIAADGESIPYGRAYSTAHRSMKGVQPHRKRNSFVARPWRSVKRFFLTPIYPMSTAKGRKQAFAGRMIFLAVALAVGLYVEARLLWWFTVGAVLCGALVAVAIRRSGR